MPLLVVLVLCLAACFQENMSEHLASLIVAPSVEAILNSDVLGEYPRVDYQGTIGTLYAGSESIYFTGISSYLFLERTTALVTWQSVRQIQKLNEHGIELIVTNDATLQEVSHVFTLTDHGYDRDKIWAFWMSIYNDALVDHHHAASSSSSTKRPSPRNGSVLKRTNSDPLMQASALTPQAATNRVASAGHDAEASSLSPEIVPSAAAQDATITNRPSMSLSQAASAYLDQQISAQAGGASLDVQAVEALAGKLTLQPIPCQYNAVDGKLYAGKTAIYFVGRKFFIWSKQEVLVPWESVRKIQLLEGKRSQTNETVPIGVQVLVRNDNESPSSSAATIHSFLDVDNAGEVVSSLQGLHNEQLKPRRRQSRSVRRTNSDPMMNSLGDMDHLVGGKEGVAPVDDAKGNAPVKPEKMVRSLIPQHAATTINHEAEWAQVLQENRFPTKVVTDHLLDCDLDRLFDVFFRDDAKHSIAAFMEGRGDSSLETTLWTKEGANETRTITYIHPVNAPMAPPQAAARKEQSLRRYGSHGLVLETKTIVQDVPMVDCFYVTDRIRAESRGDNQVAVSIEFNIVFVKSTMFKGIISRTTNSECTALFQALAKYMSEALGESPVAPAAKLVAAAVEPEHASFWESLTKHPLLLPLLLSIALLQLFIWRDVRQTKASMRILESTVEQLLRLQEQNAASCAANGVPSS